MAVKLVTQETLTDCGLACVRFAPWRSAAARTGILDTIFPCRRRP